jgi:hypothetical protein
LNLVGWAMKNKVFSAFCVRNYGGQKLPKDYFQLGDKKKYA